MPFSSVSADPVRNLEFELAEAPCAPVRLESTAGGKITVGLLIDGPLGKAGTMLTLARPVRVGGLALEEIVAGRPHPTVAAKNVAPSAVGDVLVFENAIARGDELIVGRLVTRTHDGMSGPVQVARVLAMPTSSSVSKRGARQDAIIADPSKAVIVRNPQELEAFAKRELAGRWPGGRYGLVLRNKNDCGDILADEDPRLETVDAFIKRLVEDNKVLEGGPVEVTPIWRLPMGREQVMRDIDPREVTNQKVVGPFTKLYANKEGRCFQPSIAIFADEDEWAFGGKTGRRHRVIAGLHPLMSTATFKMTTLPTPARSNGEKVAAIRCLFKTDTDVDAAARARAERQPKAPPRPANAAPVAQAARGFGGLRRTSQMTEPEHDDAPRFR